MTAVEAASLRRPKRPRPTRRQRRRRHRAVWLAALLYAGFAVVALLVVARSLDAGVPSLGGSADEATDGAPPTISDGPEQLALTSIGARAQRSTVGVGGGTGFVAWETNGLALVLTSRPAEGWRTDGERTTQVAFDGRTYTGTLARTDARTRLGLVRVRETGFADALWQEPRPEVARSGDLVVLVGRRAARTVEIDRVGANRIYFRAAGLASFAGAPVLSESGRLVAVVDAGGGATPIDRACGVIRRC
jgi:hypothetical protein